MFQGLPGELQHQPLAGVEVRRLVGRNVEEKGIEAVETGEEAAVARRHPPGRRGIGIIEGLDVEAVRRNRGDRVDTLPQEAPVRGQIRRPGQAAAHADDGDRLGFGPGIGRGGGGGPAGRRRRFLARA